MRPLIAVLLGALTLAAPALANHPRNASDRNKPPFTGSWSGSGGQYSSVYETKYGVAKLKVRLVGDGGTATFYRAGGKQICKARLTYVGKQPDGAQTWERWALHFASSPKPSSKAHRTFCDQKRFAGSRLTFTGYGDFVRADVLGPGTAYNFDYTVN